uniref:Large ribosomal subunit protein bL20c n=2 Tax=Selaginella TaxID=3246 RepID=A0A482CNL2_9TRAC|nr:ribosomal protein L20 [Selaginella sanguinolenta]QBL76351.1 ribosomal protein L20 [Selaginella sanguinolenta]QGU93112.1 ribosomal protein L20 [Selaginella nummulariifolia]QGU93251.1 ribosomal protein L20 [Selaginella sanguinolenta]
MTRAKRGYAARKHRRNIIQLASGFRGAHSKIVRASNQQVVRAPAPSHRDRDKRKRDFRRPRIARINAAARNAGVSHTKLIRHSSKNQVLPNRKIPAQMAVPDTESSATILRISASDGGR